MKLPEQGPDWGVRPFPNKRTPERRQPHVLVVKPEKSNPGFPTISNPKNPKN